MLNVLITGHTGLVGNNLLDELSESMNCFGISESTGTDISKYENLKKIDFSPDIIIHCASKFDNDNIEDIVMTNEIGTINICRYAKENNVKHLIFTSSISALDHKYNEYHNRYGISKMNAEKYLKYFCKQFNIKYSILRFTQIYDNGNKGKKNQYFLYYLIDTLQKNKELTIYGTKNPFRSYMHIDDVVEIIKKVINEKTYGEFMCTHPEKMPLMDLIECIRRITHSKSLIKFDKNKEDIRSFYIPEDYRLYQKLKYFPRVSFSDGIKKILEYEKI